MTKIVLNFKDLNPTEVADRLRTLAASLITNTADFVNPDPSPADLTAAATLIDGKEAAAKAKDQEASAMRGQRDTAVAAGTALALSLLNWTMDNVAEDKWDEVFDRKKAPVPTTSMAQVMGLAASFGDSAGELDLIWNPVDRAKSYEIQIRYPNLPNPVWVHAKTAGSSHVKLTGLTSTQNVQIRVRAIGPNDLEGAFSDLTEHLVP